MCNVSFCVESVGERRFLYVGRFVAEFGFGGGSSFGSFCFSRSGFFSGSFFYDVMVVRLGAFVASGLYRRR